MADRRKNRGWSEHIRLECPERDRRKLVPVDRRFHAGWCRILFIPVGDFISRFAFRR